VPELAEVEYFRRQWDPGLRRKIDAVELHAAKRVFRGSDPRRLRAALTGARLIGSEARGKQMLFHFSGGAWLGAHLGMTGGLHCEPAGYLAQKHDHLVLRQRRQTLVYRDARMFGRIRFDEGAEPPEWWRALPPAVTSPELTTGLLREWLGRRRRAPLKAVLLDQAFFPGVGNWMADEILWQSGLHPGMLAGELTAANIRRLHGKAQFVCRTAMETIGVDWSDPPAGWLIHVRWKAGGLCPKHRAPLERAQVAGRTTAWCGRCQPRRRDAG
jgi:formamidopyrimidine-DNA glycosylase